VSETVAIALIAVAGTIGSGALSGGLAFRASRLSTRAELAAVDAELKKLSMTQKEEIRKERKAMFCEFLDASDSLETCLEGGRPSDVTEKSFHEVSTSYRRIRTLTELLADSEVVAAVGAQRELLLSILYAAEESRDDSLAEALRNASADMMDDMVGARTQVVSAMKAELGQPGLDIDTSRRQSSNDWSRDAGM
jgi:hypothetical protein